MNIDTAYCEERLEAIADECERGLAERFAEIDRTAFANQKKVINAFRENHVSAAHLYGTTGYGYDDLGRDTLDRIFARIFGAESALVRHSIISGTHALTVALFGLLRPGDTLLSVTGKPYDTLDGVIGINGSDGSGSLADFGVKYTQVELAKDGSADRNAIAAALSADNRIKVVFLQRSKGYGDRRTFSSAEIGELAHFVKSIKPDVFFAVDNCYGEFCCSDEPTAHGADLIIGSLIKNPGGGIARCGGYVAGTKRAVELVSYRATAPGIGAECGASLDENREMYRGIFMAPHTVAQALKTAVFAAALFEKLGYGVLPSSAEPRYDIIQMIRLGSPEALCAFCRGIQSASPIDSHVTPEPWEMPGYSDKVIMAAGTFVQGASVELSADAPLRAPYNVYLQGGLTYESGRLGVLVAAKAVLTETGAAL